MTHRRDTEITREQQWLWCDLSLRRLNNICWMWIRWTVRRRSWNNWKTDAWSHVFDVSLAASIQTGNDLRNQTDGKTNSITQAFRDVNAQQCQTMLEYRDARHTGLPWKMDKNTLTLRYFVVVFCLYLYFQNFKFSFFFLLQLAIYISILIFFSSERLV